MIMMRTLRRDYARYSKDDDLDDLERDLGDEYGWKQVHGDVFRPPPCVPPSVANGESLVSYMYPENLAYRDRLTLLFFVAVLTQPTTSVLTAVLAL